jgi:hypothetical protein
MLFIIIITILEPKFVILFIILCIKLFNLIIILYQKVGIIRVKIEEFHFIIYSMSHKTSPMVSYSQIYSYSFTFIFLIKVNK